MQVTSRPFSFGIVAGQAALGLLLIAAIVAAFCLAPVERTMGDAQRIVYVHVPVAWLGLLGMVAMAVSSVFYLTGRDLCWDHWSRAAGEVGWLCCSLTLITGSFWARQAWGTWWEWDPRLTTSFILWVIYSGILLARSSVDDPHRRARTGAVLAILGALDVPLVVMATRWFRGLHPVSPHMAPAMRITLLIGIAAWTLLFVWLTYRRRVQVGLEHLACDLRRQSDRWSARQGEWKWEH
jgi:heme exporter protein C